MIPLSGWEVHWHAGGGRGDSKYRQFFQKLLSGHCLACAPASSLFVQRAFLGLIEWEACISGCGGMGLQLRIKHFRDGGRHCRSWPFPFCMMSQGKVACNCLELGWLG